MLYKKLGRGDKVYYGNSKNRQSQIKCCSLIGLHTIYFGVEQ